MCCLSTPRLAVLLASLVLSHEARNTIRILNSVCRIAERERCTASRLWVICGLELIESSAAGEIVCERDVRWQVGARVESAGALAAVEGRHEGVLVDPVGAREGTVQALRDAVAGAVDAIAGVEVDFCHNASHVNASEVADAARLVLRDHEIREFLGVDLIFADGAVTDEVLVRFQ